MNTAATLVRTIAISNNAADEVRGGQWALVGHFSAQSWWPKALRSLSATHSRTHSHAGPWPAVWGSVSRPMTP